MRTRLRFKIISFLIILSVVALVISQAYWLRTLYDSIWKTTQLNITESLKMADYKELFLRMEKIKQQEGEDGKTRFITYDIDQAVQGSGPSDTIRQEDITFVELFHLLDVLGNLESDILHTMHQVLDSISPVSYSQYDSLLVEELKEKNVYTDYSLRVIQTRDSVPFAAMEFSSTDKSTYIPIDQGIYFDYPVISEPEQFYRLYIHSPTSAVLRQMAGILVSSGLLLILIIIAFIYLLRTILKQKTVEELKSDFTNNVTHELKTPIAVAYAANDVLLNHNDTVTEKQVKYMNIIKEQLSRLTGMVEQILTLSVENRTTFKLNPEEVHVAELLPPLMEQHKLKTNKNITFKTDVPDDFIIKADRAHLYNMISNLIENAVKYTDEEKVHITVEASASHNEKTISVADNGIGINEANQKRVFDKFYRVPQGNLHNVKGYGLGLYYIKDIMNKHNGSVTVKSQPGKGSVFTLHFNKE